MRRAIGAYEEERNVAGASINWRFTAQQARAKLPRLYPCHS